MTGAHPPRAGWCRGSAPRHSAANKATAFIPSNNSTATHGCSHLRVLPPVGAAPSKTPPLRPLSPTSGIKNKSLGDMEGGKRGWCVCVCPPYAGAAGAATLPQLPDALKNNNQRGKKKNQPKKTPTIPAHNNTAWKKTQAAKTNPAIKEPGILAKLAVQLSSFLLYADNHLIILLMTVQPARK